MPRWDSGAAERLQEAAAELFLAGGYEQTTAADIARAAGLTERTFFRYFSDKRDVLFLGQEAFAASFLEGISSTATGASATEFLEAALRAAASLFPDERRDFARARHAIIERYPALQERERHKGADLARLVTGALRERSIPEPTASLAGESAVTVFHLAFVQWLEPGNERPLEVIAVEMLTHLLALGSTR